MFIYCVRDRKARVLWPPVFERDHVQAIRSFEQACRDSKSQFAQWPDDFELVCVGEFDHLTGKGGVLDLPIVLADPRQFLASERVTGDGRGEQVLRKEFGVAKATQ